MVQFGQPFALSPAPRLYVGAPLWLGNKEKHEGSMQKIAILACLLAVAACGVPPEEDAAAKVGFAPNPSSDVKPVTAEDLARSEAWARLLSEYR